MRKSVRRLLLPVIAVMVYGTFFVSFDNPILVDMSSFRMAASGNGVPDWVARRSLTSIVTVDGEQVHQHRTQFDLPPAADQWCGPPILPPLDYHDCPDDEKVNQLHFIGGLTNSLKFTLLGAIQAYEMNRCFTVDENNHLIQRSDPSQALTIFTTRYFEPIGLGNDDPRVVEARRKGKIDDRHWRDVWDTQQARKGAKLLFDVPALNYTNIEGHDLKRQMMRRVWRPLPAVREATCTRLEEHGLHEPFIAFGVRRGDKTLEGFTFSKAKQYIQEAQKAITKHFDGKTPKIFVATDDCAAMQEFRRLRPDWIFVSECPGESDDNSITGFVLREMKDWTLDQTDAHYRKFFVELYASAIAKVFIGVTYTNGTYTHTAGQVDVVKLKRWQLRQCHLSVLFRFVSSLLSFFANSNAQHEHSCLSLFLVSCCFIIGICLCLRVLFIESVAWWTYFMRNDRWSFKMIDQKPGVLDHMLQSW